jgi:hypothetical protein
MHDIRQKRECRAAAQRSHQSERHQIGWKMHWSQDRAEQFRQQIDSARAFEHSNRYQHRHQKRNDSQNDVERFLSPFHELVINLDPARGSVDREKTQQKRNRQDRQDIDHSRKGILQRGISRHWQSKEIRHHHS